MAEAGYPDGLEITLAVADLFPRIVDTAVVLQEMMKAANITITLDKVPSHNYWAEKYMQTSLFVSWWGAVSEPDFQLSLAYITDGTFNESGWSSPQVDTLVVQARGTSVPEERQRLYTEIQEIISREGAVIIPYIAPTFMATRAKVQGLVPETFTWPQVVWLREA